jgi:RNA 3'-terminal phosphate cyclase (ATP)
MIYIDGSYMEGGGQIVRTALALSTLTGQPFKVDKIRHRRPKPGLKAQHLSCIDALKRMANARVDGDQLGAAAFEFFPGKICANSIAIDIGTAGSITLLLQSLLVPCLFADGPVSLKITGGTDTKWSIPIDYFDRVILPYFNRFAAVEINEIKRGYYPKGQGRLHLGVTPCFHLRDFKTTKDFTAHLKNSLSKISLTTKAPPAEIQGKSSASNHLKKAKVAERQARGAAGLLDRHGPVSIVCEYQNTASAGSVITLWAAPREGSIVAGADALGEKGLPAEKVGAAAAKKLMAFLDSDAVVDHHLADNLVPLLALVGGTLTTDRMTGHIRSNIYVCEKFLDVSFCINENDNRISVEI